MTELPEKFKKVVQLIKFVAILYEKLKKCQTTQNVYFIFKWKIKKIIVDFLKAAISLSTATI